MNLVVHVVLDDHFYSVALVVGVDGDHTVDDGRRLTTIVSTEPRPVPRPECATPSQ